MTWLLKTHKALKEQSDGSFESICWILCFVGLRMLGNDHTLCSHGLLVTNINREAPPTSKSSDPPPRSDGLPPPLLTTSPLVASQPTSVTGDSLLSTHPQYLLNSSQNAWQWPMIILHEVRALPCTNMPQSSKYLAWNPVSLCLAVLKCGRSFLTKPRYVCASIQLTPNFPWLFTMNTLCSYVFWLNPVMKVIVSILEGVLGVPLAPSSVHALYMPWQGYSIAWRRWSWSRSSKEGKVSIMLFKWFLTDFSTGRYKGLN